MEPLKRILVAYSDALEVSERQEGYATFCAQSSQRLFINGRLLPSSVGWRHICEPEPIRQVEDDLDALLANAEQAQLLLQERIAGDSGLADRKAWPEGQEKLLNPRAAPTALFAQSSGPKARAQAEVKAAVLFQASDAARRHRLLLDLARLTLVFANCEQLQLGLEAILSMFDVGYVGNRYNAPDRLGGRYVQVLVSIDVENPGGMAKPHVCELRLEELCFFKARAASAPHMEEICGHLRALYDRADRNSEAVAYLARATLESIPEAHSLRAFRCHLARRFGSVVGAWRRSMGSSTRMLTFERLLRMCETLKRREQAPEYWSELEPGVSGCISLFELDPEAVVLLARLHEQLLAVAEEEENPDAATFFAVICRRVRPKRKGHLNAGEFRAAVKPLAFSSEEADRLFTYLDYQGGEHLNPPATVTEADFAWLLRLPHLVDLQGAVLQTASQPTRGDRLRGLAQRHYRSRSTGATRSPTTARPRSARRAGEGLAKAHASLQREQELFGRLGGCSEATVAGGMSMESVAGPDLIAAAAPKAAARSLPPGSICSAPVYSAPVAPAESPVVVAAVPSREARTAAPAVSSSVAAPAEAAVAPAPGPAAVPAAGSVEAPSRAVAVARPLPAGTELTLPVAVARALPAAAPTSAVASAGPVVVVGRRLPLGADLPMPVAVGRMVGSSSAAEAAEDIVVDETF